MERQAFDDLVARLEAFAARHPRAYRARVALLVVAGYACLVGLLLVVFSLAVAALWGVQYASAAVKLTLGLSAFAYGVGRVLRTRLPSPGGLPVTRRDAPALFALLEQIRRAVGGPRLSHVWLVGDFNAGVTQLPRLGLSRAPTNHLALGLPLMLALSPEQLRAVLAHEIGHVSRAHGYVTGWVHRVRSTWQQLVRDVDGQRRGAFLIKRFCARYFPYVAAYSLVLSRRQEYEADASAATFAGARGLADALVRLEVIGAFLKERFWPALLAIADDDPTPPDPYARLQAALEGDLAPAETEEWLAQTLARSTTSADTHPSLADRLQALREMPSPPLAVERSAAEEYLGPFLSTATARLGEAWRASIRAQWQQRYCEVAAARRELTALAARAGEGPLGDEEAWRHATLTEQLHGSAAALPLYEAMIARNARLAPAHFAIGRIRLAAGDENGVAALERAMALDLRATAEACRWLHSFFVRYRREQEARRSLERLRRHEELMEAAKRERATVRAGDTFRPHGLTAEQVASLVEQVRFQADVRKIYLVQKVVAHFPESRLWVVGVVPRRMRWRGSRTTRELMQDVARTVDCPGETLFVLLTGRTAAVRRAVTRVPASLVYGG